MPAPVDDEILDVAGIAEFLKVKERWVYRSAREYGVPMFLVGKKFLRARKSELNAWLEQQRVY
ncbi:helix-turn-helix domain-containing protein [Nonomuraea typhae]|uniref:Helix-turn-helix domain-containing protein n=1 Tax=Nonomuraea typhae TaxID=2603600 RepID=A0ABW7YJJ7_9ACTN